MSGWNYSYAFGGPIILTLRIIICSDHRERRINHRDWTGWKNSCPIQHNYRLWRRWCWSMGYSRCQRTGSSGAPHGMSEYYGNNIGVVAGISAYVCRAVKRWCLNQHLHRILWLYSIDRISRLGSMHSANPKPQQVFNTFYWNNTNNLSGGSLSSISLFARPPQCRNVLFVPGAARRLCSSN